MVGATARQLYSDGSKFTPCRLGAFSTNIGELVLVYKYQVFRS